MDFGRKLLEYRNKLNLSRKEVADKIGVSVSAYSNYETGNRSPHLELLPKIAAALQVSIDALFDNNPPPAEIAAGRTEWAGLTVEEKGGLYAPSGIKPSVWESMTFFEKDFIGTANEKYNLSPLPASDFEKAVNLARQHVIDENKPLFILWLLRMIDHQHYLKKQAAKEERPIPLSELEEAQKREVLPTGRVERTKKEPPANE